MKKRTLKSNERGYSHQLTFVLGAAIGSEKPKKGRAKLTNPFLYDSIFLLPFTSLYISRQTSPTTREVVVAMAGIILPAMPLL